MDANTVRGPLRGYKVQVWTDNDMAKGVNEITLVEGASTALITNLVPFTRNYARVLVFNDRYNGPPSNTITIDTPEGGNNYNLIFGLHFCELYISVTIFQYFISRELFNFC